MTIKELLEKAKRLDATHISCRTAYFDQEPRFFRIEDNTIYAVSDVACVVLHEIPCLTQSVFDLQIIVNLTGLVQSISNKK